MLFQHQNLVNVFKLPKFLEIATQFNFRDCWTMGSYESHTRCARFARFAILRDLPNHLQNSRLQISFDVGPTGRVCPDSCIFFSIFRCRDRVGGPCHKMQLNKPNLFIVTLMFRFFIHPDSQGNGFQSRPKHTHTCFLAKLLVKQGYKVLSSRINRMLYIHYRDLVLVVFLVKLE